MKTKREDLKMLKRDELVKAIKCLLEKNLEAEKGYKKALQHSESLQLKAFLKKQAFLHARFATELGQYLYSINERFQDRNSFISNIHRAWIDFGSFISNSSDDFIFQECIRGEKIGINEYQDKLTTRTFSPELKFLLAGQLKAMKQNIEGIRNYNELP